MYDTCSFQFNVQSVIILGNLVWRTWDITMPSFKLIILLCVASTMKCVLSKLSDILLTFNHWTTDLISLFTISMTAWAFLPVPKLLKSSAKKNPASGLFTQSFIQTQIKENIKAPRHWPLCGEFTGTGEFPAQRASYAENVSIWWRHHAVLVPSYCV